MKNFLQGLIVGLLIASSIMFTYYNNKYSYYRSQVIGKTGYDISYPKDWKGTCR